MQQSAVKELVHTQFCFLSVSADQRKGLVLTALILAVTVMQPHVESSLNDVT